MPPAPLITCGLVLCLGLAPLASAQDNFGPSWKSLSPDLRQQKGEQIFSTLTEQKQQQLRENQKKFHALTPDQKRTLCLKFLEQHGYAPPACRDLLEP